MRGAWLGGVLAVVLWGATAPADAAVVSVDGGRMTVEAPEGGDLLVECSRPPQSETYCDVLFASSVGGVVTGRPPECLPQTIGGRVRCSGVTARDVTMGAGNDRLTLSSSASSGYGQLFGGTIDMGAGDDAVHLGESYGSDVLLEGDGVDTVSYEKRHGALAITAGAGADDGTSTERDDVRAEIVEGGRGNDVLTDASAAGAVRFLGGTGHDLITGGAGANELDGQHGDDTIHGLGGDDLITGGPDGLPAFIADADVLSGGDGNDLLDGGSHADRLSGGAGDEIALWGGAGADELRGDAGDDALVPGPGSDPVVSGGDGADRLRYDLGFDDDAGAVIDLPARIATRGGETDGLDGIEDVHGGEGDDQITGTDGPNDLVAGGGADVVRGGLGADVFHFSGPDTVSYDEPQRTAGVFVDVDGGVGGAPGEGDRLTGASGTEEPPANVAGSPLGDVILGGAAANVLSGRGGDDILDGGLGAADQLHGGEGSDTASYARIHDGRGVTASLAADRGGETGDALSVDGFTSIENLVGGAGDDVLTGDAGANRLAGGGGDDTLRPGTAGGGSDGEADVLDGGGSDRDVLSFDDRSAGVVANLTAGTADGDAVVGVERITGGAGDDVLTGDADLNRLDGGGGNDHVDGGAGDDDLRGGAGTADTVSFASLPGPVTADLAAGTASGGDALAGFEHLTGTAAGDTLAGDDGANRIDGGPGADTVRGRDGDDVIAAADATADDVDCGLGTDAVTGDRIDAIANCETEDLGTPPHLSIADVAVDEDAGEAILTIAASAASARPMEVRLVTAGDTATPGADFTGRDVVATVVPGALSATVPVPIHDDGVDETDREAFLATLSEPAGATIADGKATVTIADDDTAAVSVSGASVTEGGGLQVPVSLSTTSSRDLSVTLMAGAGTAAAEDFEAGSRTVTVPAGETEAAATIATAADALDESDETVALTLSAPTHGELGTAGATGTIVDDDAMPLVSVSGAEAAEGESPVARVALSAPSGRDVKVQLATADGSAAAPADYAAGTTTLKFAPGTTEVGVPLSIAEDATYDPGESFDLALSAPVNATLGSATAAVSIADDDAAPVVSVKDAGAVAEDGAAVFLVELAGATERTARVTYATAEGTAGAADFEPATGSVEFAPGVTSRAVSVPVRPDTLDEPDEDFALVLGDPLHATVTTAKATATIRDDDEPAPGGGTDQPPAGDGDQEPRPQPPAQPPATPPTTPPAPPLGGAGPAGQPAKRCVVPRLRGRTVRGARRMLARAGCRVRRVKRRHNTIVRRGRVSRSYPHAGTSLREGAAVTIVVSRGARRRR